jgi:hypothetical protein
LFDPNSFLELGGLAFCDDGDFAAAAFHGF